MNKTLDRGIYREVGAASANNKGDMFRAGSGRAVVVQNICDEMNEGPTFVARLKILSSASKGDVDPRTKQPIPPNAPGSKVGWPQKLRKHKSALGNVKSYLLNVLGINEAEVTVDEFASTLEHAVAKKGEINPETKQPYTDAELQPMRGFLVDFTTYQQQTAAQKAAGKGEENTYVRFIHVPMTEGLNDEASVAARRAELDKTDPIV